MTAVRAEDLPDADGEAGAVRAAASDYLAAVQRGDTEALLRIWTENGDYQDATGTAVKAHDLIRKQASAPRPKNAPANIPAPKSSLRFVTPTVAIEDGNYDCGTADDGSAVTGRFTALWVKRDGRWLLDSLREATATSASQNENLKPLEWLIGEWVGTTDDCVMLVSSRWSDGGNYIIREFAVRGDGGDTTGTERISWEPISGEFTSWTFDSQDGRGEGRWKQDGNRWLVETTEVMGDGKKASTLAAVTPSGDGHFVWEVQSSKIGNQKLPSRRVKFTRAPEVE